MTNNFRHFPLPITTPRVLLRPPQLEDIVAINAGVNESLSELKQFMPWAQELAPPEVTETFVRTAMANWVVQKNEEPWFPIFIFDQTTGEFLGGTGYHHIDWNIRCLEIGYWIRTSKSGAGYVTEAVNALTRYAFIELKMQRVAICCDVQNLRSSKVPKRLGFEHEATLKKNRLTMDGQISDTLVFTRYTLQNLPELAVMW